MGWIIACWRRFFGGADSRFDILEKRGIQCIFLIGLIFCWEFFVKHQCWYISLIVAVLVYIFFCKSHWYYFKCGTESDKYIDEEMAKGRKPAMNWLVSPINKFLGFEERSIKYCFVGLTIRYTLYALPIAFLIGWHFMACALAVPFIYNAMFWVELPKFWKLESPTNWAEFFAGLAIGWGLW
jgi:hypothetical protein